MERVHTQGVIFWAWDSIMSGVLGFGLIENTSIAAVAGVSAFAAQSSIQMIKPLGMPYQVSGAVARGGTWMGGLMGYGLTGAAVGVVTDLVARQAPTLVGSIGIEYAGSMYIAGASGAGGAMMGYAAGRFV